jgi:hypothetical protein
MMEPEMEMMHAVGRMMKSTVGVMRFEVGMMGSAGRKRRAKVVVMRAGR